MKNIISLVVLMASIVYPQTTEIKSQTELKQLSAVSYRLLESGNHHFPQSSLKFQESEIEYKASGISYVAPDPRKKSPALAILYSMVLPGMGELYANSYESGKYFTIADGALWGVFTGFTIYGRQQENNYKSFAQSKAGVNLNGKDADYFANIGAYESINDYNTEMEQYRDFDRTYNPATDYWKWASDDQRKEYRNIWNSSESAFTNVRFVVGALILNRVISVINAVRLVSAYNKNLPQDLSWNVSMGISNNPTLPSSLTFNFVKTF